jgi:hypothetical protein
MQRHVVRLVGIPLPAARLCKLGVVQGAFIRAKRGGGADSNPTRWIRRTPPTTPRPAALSVTREGVSHPPNPLAQARQEQATPLREVEVPRR